MNSGEVATWLGFALAVLAAIFGAFIYIHEQIKIARQETEARIAAAELRFKEDLHRVEFQIESERTARREDVGRLERAIAEFQHMGASLQVMGKSIEHLADKMSEQARHMEAVVESVTHTVRSIDLRMSAPAVRERSPRPPRPKRSAA
jgi:uncharacterized protein (TIGR02588 family)